MITRVPTNDPKFLRDSESKAIVSQDTIGLQNYRSRRARLKDKDQRLNKLEAEVDELKQILRKIADAGNH